MAFDRKAYSKKYYLINKEKLNRQSADWYAKNKDKADARSKKRAKTSVSRGTEVLTNMAIKEEVLSHYSPDGVLRCSAPGCLVNDLDMLSIDHINNNGSGDRKGIKIYERLKKDNYPKGFQTLCHNHNWKKELVRRRRVVIDALIADVQKLSARVNELESRKDSYGQ